MNKKKPRNLQSVSDMVRSLALVGLLVGALATFVWLTRADSEQSIRPVDWQAIAVGAKERTELMVLGPVGLTKDWVATSARIEKVGDSDVWRAGFISPTNEFVSIIVSNAETKRLVKAYANLSLENVKTRVIAQKNYSYVEEGKTKAIYSTENGNNILIYATADWDEITTFISKLVIVN
jgi:hypothetical protein